ncbi:MmgE/PrpD family protein [Thermoplasmatales archaeon AK]|nr:MmgE/PrpD family protein [Thermoplasmatales archaeon AK]
MRPETIGEFASYNGYKNLPSAVRESAKLAILNFMAVTIGANSYDQSKIIIMACQGIQEGNFPIYGSSRTAGIIGSTWANSALSHLLDFDDTHLETIVHPSAPVIPGAMNAGIQLKADGKDLIYSAAIGMEIAIRLAMTIGLDERYSDWHNTSLFGTAAGAVAYSLMHKPVPEIVTDAFLQGLTVATGFLSNRGTVTKSFQVGRSAAEGVISGIAAMNGVTVSKNIPNTFALSLTGKSDLEKLTQNLGKEWEILRNFLKPYPCGVVLHPGIDAAIELRNKIKIQEVERIDVFVNPVVPVLTGIMEPKNGLESKFSVPHAIAAALLFGPLYPEHFSDTLVKEAAVVSLRKRVHVYPKEDINRGQTRIEIILKDGRKEISEINRGSVTPSKHLTLEEVKTKFYHLVIPVYGESSANDIWEYFVNIEQKHDLGEIIELFHTAEQNIKIPETK